MNYKPFPPERINALDDMIATKLDQLEKALGEQFDAPGTLYSKLEAMRETRVVIGELHDLIIARKELFKSFIDGLELTESVGPATASKMR